MVGWAVDLMGSSPELQPTHGAPVDAALQTTPLRGVMPSTEQQWSDPLGNGSWAMHRNPGKPACTPNKAPPCRLP